MSETKQGFLAGGNFITDYVKVIDAWPEQDTLASIRSQSMINGGGPYNILKNLAVLAPDLPREACGLVGADANGDWVVADCQAAGVDVRQLHRTGEAATSYTDAMTVASSGRRTFFHQRGANAQLGPGHFDFTATSARIFVLGYLMLLDTLDAIDDDGVSGAAKVLRAAREAGIITAVDCVSKACPDFRSLVLSARAEADMLFLNEFEIGQVLGREVSAERSVMQEAALELASQAARESTRVIVHSVSGAVVAKRDGSLATHASVALPETEIAGATGAGDAFASGFLLGAHENLDDEECLRYAVCVAAMSLRDPTPSAGMRSLQDCLELGARHGYQAR
ncbi:carbohydrate kinase family protein [Arenicella sp.]|nr:carbohydrate kinase family protein [Arenicella sp.]